MLCSKIVILKKLNASAAQTRVVGWHSRCTSTKWKTYEAYGSWGTGASIPPRRWTQFFPSRLSSHPPIGGDLVGVVVRLAGTGRRAENFLPSPNLSKFGGTKSQSRALFQQHGPACFNLNW